MTEKTNKLHFLPDKPTTKDLLGTHASLAHSVADVILSDMQRPFVLGLFGKWGTGKSSIVNILREKWAGNIKFVYVDAWRKEKSSFVQNFIKRVARTLLDDPTNTIKEITKKEVSQNGGWKPTDTANKFFWGFIVLCGLLIIATLCLWWFNKATSFPASELSGIGLTILVAVFFSWILPKHSVQFNTTTEDMTLDDPLRFRNIFINGILGKCEEKNICIIIDNIDRASAEDAIKIIKVIKTFIVDAEDEEEPIKKVSFLIPCDDTALCNHLKEKTDLDDPREFLRKFFNISLRIPPIIKNDSYHFALNLLKESKLSYSDEQLRSVASVINAALNENPRQPKQFINQFVAWLNLHEKLSPSGSEDIIKQIDNHPEWIAYFLVLQSEFGVYLPDNMEKIDSIMESKADNRHDQRVASFLLKAGWAKPPSQSIWNHLYHMKLEQIFVDIPNFKDIHDAFTEKRVDDAKRLLSEITMDRDYVFEELLKYSESDPRLFSNVAYTMLEVVRGAS